MLSVLLLSIGMSIDAIGIGISFGVRKIRIGVLPCLIISLLGFVIISLAVVSGSILQRCLPDSTGSIILIVMGIWILLQSRKEAKDTLSPTVKIIREPSEGDIDGSGDIDMREAIFLGIALTIDSIGICVGAGGSLRLAFILPVFAIFVQIVFLLIGIRLGTCLGNKLDTKLCTISSGLIIVLLGLINLADNFLNIYPFP